MNIDEEILFSDDLVASKSKFLKKYNNIYITEEQVNILQNYGIDVNRYSNLNELIHDIEVYLNDSIRFLDDLEWVSQTLSEYNYYNNVNK